MGVRAGATTTIPSARAASSDTSRRQWKPSGTSASICPALWMGSRQIDAFAKLLGVYPSRWY